MSERTYHIHRKGEMFKMSLDTEKDNCLARTKKHAWYTHETNSGETHFYQTDIVVIEDKSYEEIYLVSKEIAIAAIDGLAKGHQTDFYQDRYQPREL